MRWKMRVEIESVATLKIIAHSREGRLGWLRAARWGFFDFENISRAVLPGKTPRLTRQSAAQFRRIAKMVRVGSIGQVVRGLLLLGENPARS